MWKACLSVAIDVVREAAPPQPDRVEAREARAVAGDLRVGDGVLAHHRIRGGERRFADAHELVHARHRAEHHVILEHHVARQRREAGQHAVVPDPAVVRDVDVVEDEVPVADARAAAPVRAPDVDRRELPDHVVLADHERRILAGRAQHLRLAADHGERRDARAGADRGAAHQRRRGSRSPPRARARRSRRSPSRARLSTSGGELRPRIDDRGRVYERHARLTPSGCSA